MMHSTQSSGAGPGASGQARTGEPAATVVLPPIVQRWLETYNQNELESHMALYTDDASIIVPGLADLNPDGDKKLFRQVETALDKAAPNRQVSIDWAVTAGDVVCVEATLRIDPDRPELDTPLCIHFTMSADGRKLIRDRTYVDSSLQAKGFFG